MRKGYKLNTYSNPDHKDQARYWFCRKLDSAIGCRSHKLHPMEFSAIELPEDGESTTTDGPFACYFCTCEV